MQRILYFKTSKIHPQVGEKKIYRFGLVRAGRAAVGQLYVFLERETRDRQMYSSYSSAIRGPQTQTYTYI